MRNVHNVLDRMKITVQNVKIIWKSQMIQLEVNAYVAMCYAIIYASQAVKKGNMSILVQEGSQFASLAIKIALAVMVQKELTA